MSKKNFPRKDLDTGSLIAALQEEVAKCSVREEAEWATRRKCWLELNLPYVTQPDDDHLPSPLANSSFVFGASESGDMEGLVGSCNDDADEALLMGSQMERNTLTNEDGNADDDDEWGEDVAVGLAPGEELPMVSMQDVLETMSVAQARRHFAPTWAFIAWDMDREWFGQVLDFFFTKRRWPHSTQLPAPICEACDEICLSLKELYVQEPFPPTYVTVLRDIDKDWFDWAIDQFFSSGHWPDFSELPKTLQEACLDLGMASTAVKESTVSEEHEDESLNPQTVYQLNVPCT